MDIDFDEKSKQTYIFENISKGKVFIMVQWLTINLICIKSNNCSW